MNVRFFAGSKAQYLEIAKHNPIALYFCHDTRELFWGDLLISDGMRVVDTESRLPSLEKAADGVIYHVEESGDGYVLSPDRAKWIKVIHAPDAHVMKAISFAGTKMEEIDGVFTIDRRCAREALGFIVPEGMEYEEITIATEDFVRSEIANIGLPEINLEGYATKDDLTAAIESIEHPTVDLSTYATETYVDEKVAEIVIPTKVSELENDAGYLTEHQSLEGLATVEYVDKAVASIEIPEPEKVDLTGYATEQWVTDRGYLTEHQDISGKADLDHNHNNLYEVKGAAEAIKNELLNGAGDAFDTLKELSDLIADNKDAIDALETIATNKADKEHAHVDYAAKDHTHEQYLVEQDLSYYAKKADIPSVSGFATESYVDNKVAAIDIPTKASELENDTGYLTSQSLNGYAKREDIPDVRGLASKEELADAIESIEHPVVDFTGLATEEFVTEKLAEIDTTVDLGDYYTRAEVDTLIPDVSSFISKIPAEYVTEAELNSKGFITEHQPLDGLATEEFVAEALASIELPESEIYKVDFNAPDYAEAVKAYNSGKVLVLVNAAPDVNSYAVMNYVSEKYLTFTKFLTSRSEAYGSFNTYYLSPANTWEVSKEVKLNNVEANVDGEINGKLTSIRIGKEIYSIPSVEGFVTKGELEEAIDSITHPIIPTKVSELENDAGFITIGDVEAKNYLTAIPEGYVTQEELNAAIESVEHPTVDLEGYATEEYVKSVANTQKYEVLPVDGMLVSYRENEVRINTERVIPVKQTVGSTGNPNMYYVTFRAYAPEDATGVIESDGSQTDTEPTALTTDAYGRKYATIWSAIASFNGISWTKWGDSSTLDKYLGFYYTFKWFKEDTLIGTDKVRVILTNDACHDDLVPDAIARRIDDKVKSIKVPSIDGLVTEEQLANHNHNDLYDAKGAAEAVKNELLGGAGQAFDTLKELNDLITENKDTIDVLTEVAAGKADRADLDALATKAEVAAIESKIPSVDGFISEIPGEYITESELEAKNYLTAEALDTYATQTWIAEQNFATKSELPSIIGLASEEYVNNKVAAIKVPVKVSELENDANYLTEHQDLSDYAKRDELPSIEGLATEEYVTNAIDNIPEVDLSDYVTKSEIPSLEDYAKKDELFSGSYNDLIDKPEIPSTAGLASEEFVQNAIDAIEIPETDLSGYSTTEEMTAAITAATKVKANDVTFTESKFVTKPIGNFQLGEDIKGLTIAQIFAKLLGLSDSVAEPDEPEIPDEPQGVIDTIIANELSMYAVTADAELSEIPFNFRSMTEEQAAAKPSDSGFYQIKDASGDVIESGYQEMQIQSDDVYYVIALPKEIDYDTMVDVKAWDDLNSRWVDTGVDKPALTSDPDTVAELCGEAEIDLSGVDTAVYTILVLEGTPDGSMLRFVINE